MLKTIDKNLIEQYIKDGWLRRQWNKDKTLQVLDYTQQTTYANKWDGVTTRCRGIVLDKNYNIVMPCMPKFFNFEQSDQRQQNKIIDMFDKTMYTFATPLITKKYDGCLAAIFPYNGHLIITSKCSFDSFVVNAVREIIKDQLFVNQLENMSLGLVCEVIHPDTHILVNYGDTKELRVITGFNINTLEEFSYEEMEDRINIINSDKIKMVEKQQDMDFWTLNEWQRTHDASEEGFVVRFNNNMRVKFKSEQYLSCAKAAHHISYGAFVKYLLENYDKYKDNAIDIILTDYISLLPDELQKEAKKIAFLINYDFSYYYVKIIMLYQQTKGLTAKEIALKTDNKELNKYKGLVFNYKKGKNIDKEVFKILLEKDKEKRKNGGVSL